MTFDNQKFYNCKITLSNNDTYLVNANWIHNENLDYWSGWECSAGHDRIAVDFDFTVYGGECKNDTLGNIETGWDLLAAPTICNRTTCMGCTDDLIISKRKIG